MQQLKLLCYWEPSSDFHNVLNFMPRTIAAYANYIKLVWCNQLWCNSTFIRGKLLYSHLCRNSVRAAFQVSQINLMRERGNLFLWGDFQFLSPTAGSCHILFQIQEQSRQVLCRHIIITVLLLSITYPGNWIRLDCHPDPFDFSFHPHINISAQNCFLCSSLMLHKMWRFNCK